jgi:hypothetical protein
MHLQQGIVYQIQREEMYGLYISSQNSELSRQVMLQHLVLLYAAYYSSEYRKEHGLISSHDVS